MSYVSTRHLEKVLLTRSVEEAEILLKSVETVPRNCLRALTSDYRWVNPAPNYRTSDLSSHSFMKNFKPVLTYENNENVVVMNRNELKNMVQKTKTDENNFGPCPICGTYFSRQNTLEVHAEFCGFESL